MTDTTKTPETVEEVKTQVEETSKEIITEDVSPMELLEQQVQFLKEHVTPSEDGTTSTLKTEFSIEYLDHFYKLNEQTVRKYNEGIASLEAAAYKLNADTILENLEKAKEEGKSGADVEDAKHRTKINIPNGSLVVDTTPRRTFNSASKPGVAGESERVLTTHHLYTSTKITINDIGKDKYLNMYKDAEERAQKLFEDLDKNK